MKEPIITINGIRLSEAQSMTVRVAVQTLAMSLSDGLGEDEVGKTICAGYLRAIQQINHAMSKPISTSRE